MKASSPLEARAPARAWKPGTRCGRSPTTSAWRREITGSPSGSMASGSTWSTTCCPFRVGSGSSAAWTRWNRARRASYIRDFPTAADSQVAFRVNQIGVYAQDQWLSTPRLTLTAGLRLDVPYRPHGARDAPGGRESELRINTSLTPSGNVLWSPRLGVNYDVSGRGTTVLRGGAGFFAGHPAYVWFRSVYGTTATRATAHRVRETMPCRRLLSTRGTSRRSVPSRRHWRLLSPTSIPIFAIPKPSRWLWASIVQLPGGLVGTLDFLYTRGVNTARSSRCKPRRAGRGLRRRRGSSPVRHHHDSTGEATPSRRTRCLRFRHPAGETVSAIARTRSRPNWRSASPMVPS